MSGMLPFLGRLSGVALARSLALRARQPTDYPPPCLMTERVYSPRALVVMPDTAVCHLPIHSLSPFLVDGIYCSAAAHLIAVFAVAHVISGESLWDVIDTRLESARG
jgi:hypothetical protein